MSGDLDGLTSAAANALVSAMGVPADIATASGPDHDQMKTVQVQAWSERLQNSVEGDPDAAKRLQALLARLEESAPQPGRDGPAPAANNLHIGALIFGAASTILVALRLLSLAKFNPGTAYGILQASGTSTVVIGTVISLIPSIAIVGGAYLALELLFPKPGKRTAADEFAIWASTIVLALM
jgi:hypothetical protein